MICSELFFNRGQGITEAAERIAAEVLVAHEQRRRPSGHLEGGELFRGPPQTFFLRQSVCDIVQSLEFLSVEIRA